MRFIGLITKLKTIIFLITSDAHAQKRFFLSEQKHYFLFQLQLKRSLPYFVE